MVWDRTKWRKEYAKKNRAKINAYYRRYYQTHKAKQVARVKRWRDANPEKMKEYNDKMMEPEQREKRRLYLQKWREKNRDGLKEYYKKWRANAKLKKKLK